MKIFYNIRIRYACEYQFMAKQLTITEIARLAGVSAGTVDRILHNRGKVSDKALAAVEKVLSESGYRKNIHTSAVGLRKGFSIAVSIPNSDRGEYWNAILNGIDHALNEFSDISIDCKTAFYNQFDIYSCRAAFESIPEMKPDAVIIGASFPEEATSLCLSLDRKNIPYILVNTHIPGVFPAASCYADQEACGRLAGKMLYLIASTPPQPGKHAEYAILDSSLSDTCTRQQTAARKAGIREFFSLAGIENCLREITMPAMDPAESERSILEFIHAHPLVRSIGVIGPRGYIAADILSRNNIKDVPVLAFDLTEGNRKGLKAGMISAIIDLHPELQGYTAVKAAIRHLLYKIPEKNISHLMPVDIIVAENLPYCKNIFLE